MENITPEEFKEYLEASAKSMAECLKTIVLLNKRITQLEEKVNSLDRILGNIALN